MRTETVIGSIDWSGCNDCRHTSDKDGGCDVPEETWEDGLRVEWESVYCDSYQKREEVRDAD